MSSLELSVEQANVNLEEGTVILTGVDVTEVVTELGTEELLNAMEYSDVMEYVAQCERDKADEDYDRNSNR